MKGYLVFAFACAAVFGCMGILGFGQSPAMGSTLNLNPVPPDLAALSLTTSYTPSSGTAGTLAVTGWPTNFVVPGNVSYDITGSSSYNLNVLLNKNTGQLSSGSLAIDGMIPALGASSGTLLTGTVTDFCCMSGGGDIFEFLLKPTGGDLQHYFSGQIGIELTANQSGFKGSFLTSFATGDSQAVSDNFNYVNVPEPASICLLATAMGFGLAVATRGRSRQRIRRPVKSSEA